jgi:hypothetical protein
MILASVGKLPLNRNVHRLNSGHTARLALALLGPLYDVDCYSEDQRA